MEYTDIVWFGAPFSLLAKLDQIVVEAMRLITGATARTNIDNLYKETGWQLLSKIHEIHILKIMYKITNNRAPQNLSDILPLQIKEIPPNLERLRQGIYSRLLIEDYSIPSVRTKLSELSFPVVGSKLWRSFPAEVRTKSSHGSFSKVLDISK